MLAPNGLKKAWPPGKTPQNRYVISLICMYCNTTNSLRYKKRRIRRRRIASTRRIRRDKKRIRREE
jgi:hypothetical protein